MVQQTRLNFYSFQKHGLCWRLGELAAWPQTTGSVYPVVAGCAPRVDGCLQACAASSKVNGWQHRFLPLSAGWPALASPRQVIPRHFPRPTASLTSSPLNLLNANGREDARPGTLGTACTVVTFCYPGARPGFQSAPHVPGTQRPSVWSAGPGRLLLVSALLARYFRGPGGG